MKNFVITFAVAFVLGIALTAVGINYLNQGPDYPKGVMTVMGMKMSALKNNIQQNRCAPTDIIPHLQTLRYVGNDIEAAFGEMSDNEQFIRYASDFRATADGALTVPAANCAAAEAALSRMGKACENCHRDYKN
ncbi:MAG TPA: hypothetical protein PLF92_10410 [Arenimonas sp.]|jgi:hypothetical protein|nr:hypothetical protein [Arenimonas sp.]HPO25329.1 hypothetical protein [Arenimonas sp.]HPW33309.1 hypothetical protein [Arenimonas sp.]